ncbi:unnamed protein product [Heterobilharzia americana]|nr:unnamed protein product [Heterobilharzia americana]
MTSLETQPFVNNTVNTNTSSNIQQAVQNSTSKYTENYVNAVNMFHQYDVLETSYHLIVSRTELHFCDETRESKLLVNY